VPLAFPLLWPFLFPISPPHNIHRSIFLALRWDKLFWQIMRADCKRGRRATPWEARPEPENCPFMILWSPDLSRIDPIHHSIYFWLPLPHTVWYGPPFPSSSDPVHFPFSLFCVYEFRCQIKTLSVQFMHPDVINVLLPTYHGKARTWGACNFFCRCSRVYYLLQLATLFSLLLLSRTSSF
jgi:hypothetical protein